MSNALAGAEGEDDLDARNAMIETEQDLEAINEEDAEELADLVRELEIAEFSNVSTCIYQPLTLLLLLYSDIMHTNVDIDGQLRYWYRVSLYSHDICRLRGYIEGGGIF